MNTRNALTAVFAALALLSASGCAVQRGQETMGSYMDDTAITSSVKARFIENKEVDASSITVETLNGVVLLSGFAKTPTEKSMAEGIASRVKGVKSVRNEVVVRP